MTRTTKTTSFVKAEAYGDKRIADGGTPLAKRLASQIQSTGPIGVGNFMAACLGDTSNGYYQLKDPLGEAGDFITAPEVSGLFGEMCGLYLAQMFELAGQPYNAVVTELGPGRGTLMQDMRRVWEKLMPALAKRPIHLVETSSPLRKVQTGLLRGDDSAGTTPNIEWHESCDSLPNAPIFGIANEFFDALAVEQYVWRDNASHVGWHYRLVGLRDGKLGFVDGKALTAADLKKHQATLPLEPADADIAEVCIAGDQVIEALAKRISQNGGAMLIIDYGRNGNAGDSLQAVADHKPVDLFYQPGAVDLSHWVDFAALSRAAAAHGCRLIGPVPQGQFLLRVGLAQRAEQAGLGGKPEYRRALLAAVDRLTSPMQMGAIFKVALMVPPGTGMPPGFAPDLSADTQTNQDA